MIFSTSAQHFFAPHGNAVFQLFLVIEFEMARLDVNGSIREKPTTSSRGNEIKSGTQKFYGPIVFSHFRRQPQPFAMLLQLIQVSDEVGIPPLMPLLPRLIPVIGKERVGLQIVNHTGLY